MTKYEIEVLKKWLNEAMRQLDAEVPGQTIIPGYTDTDSSKVSDTLGMTVSVNNGQSLDDDTWKWVKHGILEIYKRKKAKFPSIPVFADVYIVGYPEHLEVTFYNYFPHETARSGFTYYCI